MKKHVLNLIQRLGWLLFIGIITYVINLYLKADFWNVYMICHIAITIGITQLIIGVVTAFVCKTSPWKLLTALLLYSLYSFAVTFLIAFMISKIFSFDLARTYAIVVLFYALLPQKQKDTNNLKIIIYKNIDDESNEDENQ